LGIAEALNFGGINTPVVINVQALKINKNSVLTQFIIIELIVYLISTKGRPSKSPRSCATAPEAIARTLARQAASLERVALESGPLTPWLVHELRALGLPVVCLDARHA
jgi:hypothetical protein